MSVASIGYLPRRFRGIAKYRILATSTSVNNCYLAQKIFIRNLNSFLTMS